MVGIVLIGIGHWGQNLLRSFAEHSGVKISGLCDTREKVLETYQHRYQDARCSTSYQSLLTDIDADAVVIATPASTHYQIALDSLRAGKHVFVEKPLAMSVQDGELLLRTAEEVKRTIMIGHIYQFNPVVQYIKEYLEQGHIGEMYYIYSQRLNLGIVRKDLNAMWNFAPHDISILQYLIPQNIHTVAAHGCSFLQPHIDDVVFLTLGFEGGITAQVHVSWLDPVKTRRMTFVGSEKMLVYDDVHPERKLQIFNKGIDKNHMDASLGDYESFGEFQFLVRAGDVHIPRIVFKEPMGIETRHFVECIETGQKPLTDGKNGLEVLRILEAAQQSLEQGGQKVSLTVS